MRPRLSTACGALLLAVAVAVPTAAPAGAASPDDRGEVEERQGEVQEGLDASRADLVHVSAELVAASERLESLQAQLPGAQAAVDQAQSEAAAARQRDAELAEELSLAEAAVTAAGLQLQERTGEADETEKVVGSVAREVYQGSGFTPLTIFVEAESAGDYADMVAFAAVARRSQNQALSRLRVQQADIRNAEARLTAERERVQELKRLAAEQVVATEAAEQAARDAEAALQGLVEQEDRAVAEFAAARAAEEADIAALEAESDRLAAQLAAIAEAERQAELERQRRAEAAAEAERQRVAEAERQRQAEIRRQNEEAARNNRPPPPPPPPVAAPPPPRSAPSSPSGNGFLSRPVEGRMSSGFGYRIHPIRGYRKLHTGTDFAAPCGTPIRAAADGRIVSAGWGGGYGNFTVIAHGTVGGASLATAYAHLSSFAVRSGTVSRGQVIGYIGTTGSSTGCHLHLETRVDGTPVDPMRYL